MESELDLSRYAGHTEAPWLKSGWRILGAGSEVVAEPAPFPQDGFSDELRHANARLIADAPLLLAEVRRLRKELKYWREMHSYCLERLCEPCRQELLSTVSQPPVVFSNLLRQARAERKGRR